MLLGHFNCYRAGKASVFCLKAAIVEKEESSASADFDLKRFHESLWVLQIVQIQSYFMYNIFYMAIYPYW